MLLAVYAYERRGAERAYPCVEGDEESGPILIIHLEFIAVEITGPNGKFYFSS